MKMIFLHSPWLVSISIWQSVSENPATSAEPENSLYKDVRIQLQVRLISRWQPSLLASRKTASLGNETNIWSGKHVTSTFEGKQSVEGFIVVFRSKKTNSRFQLQIYHILNMISQLSKNLFQPWTSTTVLSTPASQPVGQKSSASSDLKQIGFRKSAYPDSDR